MHGKAKNQAGGFGHSLHGEESCDMVMVDQSPSQDLVSIANHEFTSDRQPHLFPTIPSHSDSALSFDNQPRENLIIAQHHNLQIWIL